MLLSLLESLIPELDTKHLVGQRHHLEGNQGYFMFKTDGIFKIKRYGASISIIFRAEEVPGSLFC
jgi:hypothetical protein